MKSIFSLIFSTKRWLTVSMTFIYLTTVVCFYSQAVASRLCGRLAPGAPAAQAVHTALPESSNSLASLQVVEFVLIISLLKCSVEEWKCKVLFYRTHIPTQLVTLCTMKGDLQQMGITVPTDSSFLFPIISFNTIFLRVSENIGNPGKKFINNNWFI